MRKFIRNFPGLPGAIVSYSLVVVTIVLSMVQGALPVPAGVIVLALMVIVIVYIVYVVRSFV